MFHFRGWKLKKLRGKVGWGGRRGLSLSAHHFPASKGPLSMHVSPSTGHMEVLCNVVNKWKGTIRLWEK